MSSIKLKFRPSSVQGKEGMLYYQIIHNRQTRLIKTGYKIHTDEWVRETSEISISPTESKRKKHLLLIWRKVLMEKARMERTLVILKERSTPFTIDDIIADVRHYADASDWLVFMQQNIEQLKNTGKHRTAETYFSTLNSFMRFRRNISLRLEEIDRDIIAAYEADLKMRGVSMNTISFYMRVLRAVYNRAVEQDLTVQKYPFRHVYTGIEKTTKRAVSLDIIRKVKEADVSNRPAIAYARDMFLFSFYTRGMSFVDMAYLRKKDLKNGILSYRRRKTMQPLSIKWESCMQQIIDKYPYNPDSPYLLPIICDTTKDERSRYKQKLLDVNLSLKKLSEILGLSVPLTTYVARHSWASVAKCKNIPVSVISEGMGHNSETTTHIYLASLDTTVVDDANRLILSGL